MMGMILSPEDNQKQVESLSIGRGEGDEDANLRFALEVSNETNLLK